MLLPKKLDSSNLGDGIGDKLSPIEKMIATSGNPKWRLKSRPLLKPVGAHVINQAITKPPQNQVTGQPKKLSFYLFKSHTSHTDLLNDFQEKIRDFVDTVSTRKDK